ncbi:MAG: hypothetical protein ACRC3B_05930 [Bacteroidia bacterium]
MNNRKKMFQAVLTISLTIILLGSIFFGSIWIDQWKEQSKKNDESEFKRGFIESCTEEIKKSKIATKQQALRACECSYNKLKEHYAKSGKEFYNEKPDEKTMIKLQPLVMSCGNEIYDSIAKVNTAISVPVDTVRGEK